MTAEFVVWLLFLLQALGSEFWYVSAGKVPLAVAILGSGVGGLVGLATGRLARSSPWLGVGVLVSALPIGIFSVVFLNFKLAGPVSDVLGFLASAVSGMLLGVLLKLALMPDGRGTGTARRDDGAPP